MFPVLRLGGGAGTTAAALARDLLNVHDDAKEHFWVLLSEGDRHAAGIPSLPQADTVVRDHQ